MITGRLCLNLSLTGGKQWKTIIIALLVCIRNVLRHKHKIKGTQFFTVVTRTVTFLCSAPERKVDFRSWKRSCMIRKFVITYLFLSSSKRIGLRTFQTNHWINWNIKDWVQKNGKGCWSHEYCTFSYHVLDYYLTRTLTLLFHQSFVNGSEIHTLTKKINR